MASNDIHSVKNPTLVFSVWSMLIGILSCFYAFCSIWAIFIIILSNIVQPHNTAMVGVEYYCLGAVVLCSIAAAVSLVLARASVKRGVVNKMMRAGKIMSIVAIITSVVFSIISFLI